jgi:ABC-type cobalamin/Fe3+-siderophores transport system ATPase subunit
MGSSLATHELLESIVGETRNEAPSVLRDVLLNGSVPSLDRDLVLVIQGVRRCGKSTLLRQIAERENVEQRAILVNFEDPRLSDRLHTSRRYCKVPRRALEEECVLLLRRDSEREGMGEVVACSA